MTAAQDGYLLEALNIVKVFGSLRANDVSVNAQSVDLDGAPAVTVKAGGRTQQRDIAAGDSFLSTHDPRPHFGLGAAERVDEVDVRWPDGSHSVRRDVAARQFLRVRKGS